MLHVQRNRKTLKLSSKIYMKTTEGPIAEFDSYWQMDVLLYTEHIRRWNYARAKLYTKLIWCINCTATRALNSDHIPATSQDGVLSTNAAYIPS